MEGNFDRVELIERDYNDAELNSLSVVFTSETGNRSDAYINTRHSQCFASRNNKSVVYKYYSGNRNYRMYLYLYSGEIHLREMLSVVGNTTEVYEFVNVTVTIALTYEYWEYRRCYDKGLDVPVVLCGAIVCIVVLRKLW